MKDDNFIIIIYKERSAKWGQFSFNHMSEFGMFAFVYAIVCSWCVPQAKQHVAHTH